MATLDLLGDWKRTQYAGDLRAGDADKEVVLMGWVHRRRDLGNIIFMSISARRCPGAKTARPQSFGRVAGTGDEIR